MFRRSLPPTAFAPFAAVAPSPQPVTKKPAPRHSPLHSLHSALKGRMVNYAGWQLPVQYSDPTAEHMHCRKAAALFDVSHMQQVRVFGADRERFVERVTPAAVQTTGTTKGLGVGRQTLALLLDNDGGIRDDLIVAKHDDSVHMVLNAACAASDLAWLQEQREAFGGDVFIEPVVDAALVALQGPDAAAILSRLTGGVTDSLIFNDVVEVALPHLGFLARIARCGYTGEDGFEIGVDAKNAQTLAAALLDGTGVVPAGLAARDSLRIEAGMCLYGQEMTRDITPIEAMLMWTVKPRLEAGGFVGCEALKRRQADPSLPQLRRVGIVSSPQGGAGPVPRTGTAIVDANGDRVGAVTSGALSPVLSQPGRPVHVCQAYVPKALAKAGTSLNLSFGRNRFAEGTVAKTPFVPARYVMKKPEGNVAA